MGNLKKDEKILDKEGNIIDRYLATRQEKISLPGWEPR
jgi:hypothetical protein